MTHGVPAAPPPGPGCICCAEQGKLPAGSVAIPGAIDATLALRMCEPCCAAAFLSLGEHPHPYDPEEVATDLLAQVHSRPLRRRRERKARRG